MYKKALKLGTKKYRDEYGCYLIEGVKPIEDAIGCGTVIGSVFVKEGRTVPKIIPEDRLVILEKSLFDRLSSTETSQGIIALADKKIRPACALPDACGDVSSNVLVLDRLQDPGNVGTMIRTAEAAGYGGIIIMKGCTDVYAPKVVRAAAGSLFRAKLFYAEDEGEAIEALRASGRRIVSADADTDNLYMDADISENIALVIGNEGRGVGDALQRASDIRIRIPMYGSIESLNAAVAAGILMYQSQRKSHRDER